MPEYKLPLSIFDNKIWIHPMNNYKKQKFDKNLLVIRNYNIRINILLLKFLNLNYVFIHIIQSFRSQTD